jgi:small subunit ribosomal protein S6
MGFYIHKEVKMLRTYETVYVSNPDTNQELLDAIDAKVKGFITSSGGEVGYQDTWGIRNLSFPIKKQSKGKYNYLLYTAGSKAIQELEFYLKISEHVLTFLTVKVNDVADLENTPKPDAKDLN